MKNKIKKSIIAWLLVICMIAPMLPDVVIVNAADVTDGNNYDAMSMDTIFGLDKSLTWVFAGDSISQNDRWTQGMNGYSEWFEQYLYDIGRNDDSVILSAWSGASISEFQPTGGVSDDGKGLENMITKYNPDVVVIQMGMNDRDMTTEDFTTYYKAMLDGVYTEGETNGKIPKVVVCTPTAIPSENVYDDMYLETINLEDVADVQDSTLRISNAIKDVVAAYNTDITLCDLRSAFLEEALVLGDDYHSTFFRDSSDGKLHPNAAGQYLMFKTLCETLERDMTSPIFQLDYDDINSGTLYVDGTSDVSYENNNYTDSNEIDDATEMNKEALGIRMLASVEFTSENGTLNSSNKVDLTTESEDTGVTDALTVDEAKSMTNEYSVVFRAKFATTGFQKFCQAIFSMNADKNYTWNHKTSQPASVAALLPGSGKMYYEVRHNGSAVSNAGTTPGNFSSVTDIGGGEWHTYALVQTSENLILYVDGEAEVIQSSNKDYKLTIDIGEAFANATADTFEAYIGSLGAKDDNYRANGDFDYWQLYNAALTIDGSYISPLHYWGEQPKRRLKSSWDFIKLSEKNNKGRVTIRRYMALVGNKLLRKQVFGF